MSRPAARSRREDAKDARDKKESKDHDSRFRRHEEGGGPRRARPRSWTCPAGKGRVIAFNFNPIHRDLNHSDYRMLWNGILNWNALPPLQP